MIKLYGYWRSTAAYRVRIALNLLALDHQHCLVHLVKDGGEQHRPTYTQLNPARLVPTLVDGDVVLNQSMAIIEYLDERYGQHTLLPQDVVTRAKVRALAQDISCDIHPLNNLRVIQHLSDVALFKEQEKAQWMKHWMIRGFESIEQRLSADDLFCFGSQPTMADACLIPQLYNARRFNINLDKFELICEIEQRALALAPFALAHPDKQPDAG